ncbi:putative Ig domain-containing protein, partial [Colwellia sp. MB3u-4]|uniref:putative Ig domain-containing protein n=1 Tax=Colwellia sp. MB3u-4 TaxID=2759822 RepID=UPI0017CAA09D
NDAPVISGTPATTAVEDAAYSFTPTVSDVDAGDTQTFSISNKPTWATFSTSTGGLTGTPVQADIGTTSGIVISVADAANATVSLAAFNLTVSNTNDAPVIIGTPATTVAEDSSYSFIPTVSDVDAGDTQTFSINIKPSWATFSTSTGGLTGTPTNADVGTTSGIIISVADSANASDSLVAFNLTVSNTNDAPVITGAPATTAVEDAAYSFTPTVSDVDAGDTQTFSISNKPTWATFSTSTGGLTGTPVQADIGTTSGIVISVADAANALDSLAAFNLRVSNTNDAPIISGTPATTVAEDAAYSFTPIVSDVDAGDTQSFSIRNKPSWATFSTTTGALTGTPINADVGITSGIIISVTDAANATVSLTAFTITVVNTNDAPVISGTPATTAVEDAAYS